MTGHILIVLTEFTCTAEEYHRWYDEEHIPAVLKVPGVVSAQRFAFSEVQLPMLGDTNPGYLAIYELEGDIAAIVKRLVGELKIPKFLVMPPKAWIFHPITGLTTADPL